MGEPRPLPLWKVCGAALAAFLSNGDEAVGGSGLAVLAKAWAAVAACLSTTEDAVGGTCLAALAEAWPNEGTVFVLD